MTSQRTDVMSTDELCGMRIMNTYKKGLIIKDLRVLLDAIEEQQPPESNEPDNQAARTVGLMIDAWRRLVG
jgi:hypothetical protein